LNSVYQIWSNQATRMLRFKSWASSFVPFILAMVLALVVNACTTGQNQDIKTLKVGITTWPGFDIALYAKSSGLFKKRGLDVEFVRFENQQDSARAVLRGALDAAFSSFWDVMQSDPGDDKPVVVMVTNISHGADGIVTQPTIGSIEDLRGKRVGAKLGTVNHLILLEALKLHNIKPEQVQIEDVSNEMATQMMQEGRLDGAVVWEPLLSDTAKKIKGSIPFTTKEVDSLVIDTLVSRSKVVSDKDKKAALTQFISAWFDVMHAVDTKSAEVFEQVGKQLGQSGSAFGSDYAGLTKGDIAMNQRMFQPQGRLREAAGLLPQLLRDDPRPGRIPRTDVEINAEPVTAAIGAWKP
jgi:NitT/TauT family transport system substrate-binding protein